MGFSSRFSLKITMDWFGPLVSNKIISRALNFPQLSINSFTLKICDRVLKQMASINPSSGCSVTLGCKDYTTNPNYVLTIDLKISSTLA